VRPVNEARQQSNAGAEPDIHMLGALLGFRVDQRARPAMPVLRAAILVPVGESGGGHAQNPVADVRAPIEVAASGLGLGSGLDLVTKVKGIEGSNFPWGIVSGYRQPSSRCPLTWSVKLANISSW
jgi:uncharacterized protein YcbK (DUF882 family)